MVGRRRFSIFFFQAEDGIRDLVRSRGLGDVYKRQVRARRRHRGAERGWHAARRHRQSELRSDRRTAMGLSLIHI